MVILKRVDKVRYLSDPDKVNLMGLLITYREDFIDNRFIWQTASFAFLPVDLVLRNWQNIK